MGILCALFVMIKSGSRGPIFSMLIVVALYLLPQMKRGYKVLTIATVFIIYFAFVHLSTRMASDSAEYSNLERLELINAVFESKFNIIRGVGIGGFGMFVRGEDIYLYPHNMIIETYIETGLVGGFFLMAILFNLFKRGYRNSVWFMYCFYFFVNAMVSGDIAANN